MNTCHLMSTPRELLSRNLPYRPPSRTIHFVFYISPLSYRGTLDAVRRLGFVESLTYLTYCTILTKPKCRAFILIFKGENIISNFQFKKIFCLTCFIKYLTHSRTPLIMVAVSIIPINTCILRYQHFLNEFSSETNVHIAEMLTL